MKIVNTECFREGEWHLCERNGWPDNFSYRSLVAWCWRKAAERYLIVVNLSDSNSQGRVQMPWDGLKGWPWRLTDLFAGAVYERDGDEMCNPGLYVDLAPWGFHFFKFESE